MKESKKYFSKKNAGAVISLICSLFIVLIDQISKQLVVQNLVVEGTSVPVINGILDFTLSYNDGMAFGLGSDAFRWVFVAIMLIVGGFLIYLMFAKSFNSKLFLASAALIIGGGIGNMIDRIINGYVVDFLALSFFPPICNLADYAITLGTVMLLVYVVFVMGKQDKKAKVSESFIIEKDTEDE